MTTARIEITIALSWCLGWGDGKQPIHEITILEQMRQALRSDAAIPEATRSIVERVKALQELKHPKDLTEIPEDLLQYNTSIGLVYGGVTKVKQYVFDAAKLPEIRGASALLDKINLVDLPAFFHGEESDRFLKGKDLEDYCEQVRQDLPETLREALIPELIIYSTGGNILAFCPTAFVDDLANSIEKRYTKETITANSCAVGGKFRPLEIALGVLHENIKETPWLDWYKKNHNEELVKAYFDQPDLTDLEEKFFARKNFNELVTKLAIQFNQRRSGNDTEERPSRRYPVMLETHPYLMRDNNGRISAIDRYEDNNYFSEPLARKRLVGQIAKREVTTIPKWYKDFNLDWQPEPNSITSWITDFRQYLEKFDQDRVFNYFGNLDPNDIDIKEAKSLLEIGNGCNSFVAFIYGDGNNMGGYIQKKIKTPEEYRSFSEDVFEATKKSVYRALECHLPPRQLQNLPPQEDSKNEDGDGDWIYPFEIIAIGGDDVILIVPADKALEVAQMIGVEFEKILLGRNREKYYSSEERESKECHRYLLPATNPSECVLSMSSGVLITSYNTPIYYMEKLAGQLLKSAKKKAKELKKSCNYHGGTIDILTLKSVTMISSSVESFRNEGLTVTVEGNPKLKLYASPYTLHEIGGLIETVRALHKSDFPRSQLYQIRSFLEQGKNTAILNYRYFRTRLKKEKNLRQGKESKSPQEILKEKFEDMWCKAKGNNGNLAPWMSMVEKSPTVYETIWREMVDLYPFLEPETIEPDSNINIQQEITSNND
jgi:CRISPR-associated protein Cmr2